MYEDLTFGDLKSATRVSEHSGVETLDDAAVEHESTHCDEKLHLHNIGEGSLNDVFVELVSGELKVRNQRMSNPDFDQEDTNINVADDEMTITIDRAGETITLVVACEGETNDDSGPDLEQLGVSL